MNDKIRQLLQQISALEAELDTALEEQESLIRYKLVGKRIVFEHALKEAHLRLKMNVFRWFMTVRPQNFLTAPVIYGMFVPLVLFDLCLAIYQWACFPIFGIARVKRAHYILFDHQHLAYLNVIEKVDCLYCSYAVGMLGYATEITARTEQYFCPIKHARKMLNEHARYQDFLEYGEASGLHDKIEGFRSKLSSKEMNATK